MRSKTLRGFQLSPQQKRLWLLQQDSSAYLTQCALLIESNLNLGILKAALRQVIRRHTILRTGFHRLSGRKFPVMVVADNCSPTLQVCDLSDWDKQERSARIEDLFLEASRQAFDWETPPLLRSTVLKLSSNVQILHICLPALCADSHTIKALVVEISRSYSAGLKNEELGTEVVQYLQFSEWQHQLLIDEDAEAANEYWHQQSSPSPSTPRLPFERQSSKQLGFEPDSFSLAITSDLIARIELLAQKYGTSVAAILLVSWKTLIWRITGQPDMVLIGMVSDRREYEELHEVMGLLATCLPIRSQLVPDLRFQEVIELVTKTLDEAEEWQDYFIPVSEGNDNAIVFPIGFEFEEFPPKYLTGDISFSLYKQSSFIEPFKVKLTCTRQNNSLKAGFYYDINYFSTDAIQRLAAQFQVLLTSATENPETTISQLEILSQSERQQLLVEFNKTQRDYPKGKCIHQLFEERVTEIPDKVAVVFEDHQLTYAELNARASQLAHYLQRVGVGPEILVGIYLERSLDIVIVLLGILKAGGAYLPLDPALPTEALALRLQDTQALILVTQQSLVESVPKQSPQVINLDSNWKVVAQESDADLSSEVSSENLVYVLFTSGSTGKPKGVCVEHQQLLNYLQGILDKLSLPSGINLATVSTFSADLGNTVIFPALSTGGCLHVVSQERASDPRALVDYFCRYSIDCLKIVPCHLSTLLASFATRSILPHQCLILGGEAASWELIEQIQQHNPNCQIFNHYGPTETTVGVLTYAVGPQREAADTSKSKMVPLGRPLANIQAYVLDKQMQPVPIGHPGELYIGGIGLARGYLNQPGLTAERFIPNPFIRETGNTKDATEKLSHLERLYKTGDLVRYLPDGTLEFLGRIDNQIKIRGFRVEVGEVEAALRQHSEVREVVVLAREDEPGDQRLVAYVVPNQSRTSSLSELRLFLRNKLPEYMLPSAFVLLTNLPLAPNGKVDRYALPPPDGLRPELEATYIAPRTEAERIIAAIWQEMLQVEKVGIEDNFFDLGGHSLLLVQVHSKLQELYDRDLSITDLFEYSTVSSLAKYLTQEQSETSSFEGTKNRAELRRAAKKQRS